MWPLRKPCWLAPPPNWRCSVLSRRSCRSIRRHVNIAKALWTFYGWASRIARRVWQRCSRYQIIRNVWTLHVAWPWHRWVSWLASIGPARVQHDWVASSRAAVSIIKASSRFENLIKIKIYMCTYLPDKPHPVSRVSIQPRCVRRADGVGNLALFCLLCCILIRLSSRVCVCASCAHYSTKCVAEGGGGKE